MKVACTTKFLAAITLVCASYACSSGDQQQQTEDELNVGSNNADSASINSASEPKGDSEPTDDFGGEGVNNVVDNEFADVSNSGTAGNALNLGGGNQAASNPTATNTATPNLMGNVAANLPAANAAAIPMNAALPANAATPTDAPVASPVPTTGGIVKYLTGPTSVSDQPGGPSVATMEKGDHPLVWDEGQFSRMPNGKYLPANSLSQGVVGRERGGMGWRSSGN